MHAKAHLVKYIFSCFEFARFIYRHIDFEKTYDLNYYGYFEYLVYLSKASINPDGTIETVSVCKQDVFSITQGSLVILFSSINSKTKESPWSKQIYDGVIFEKVMIGVNDIFSEVFMDIKNKTYHIGNLPEYPTFISYDLQLEPVSRKLTRMVLPLSGVSKKSRKLYYKNLHLFVGNAI